LTNPSRRVVVADAPHGPAKGDGGDADRPARFLGRDLSKPISGHREVGVDREINLPAGL